MSINNRELNTLISQTATSNLDNAFLMGHRKTLNKSKKRMSSKNLLTYSKAQRLERLNQQNLNADNNERRCGITPENGKQSRKPVLKLSNILNEGFNRPFQNPSSTNNLI